MPTTEIIYKTKCWGQTYEVSANWAQASDQVFCRIGGEDWTPDPHGRQVADFCHQPERALRDWILAGEDANDPEVIEAVNAAMESVEATE